MTVTPTPDSDEQPSPIVAVVPVSSRPVYVVDRSWYGYPKASREPLELVGIAVTADGQTFQLVLWDGSPQLLGGSEPAAYEDTSWMDPSAA